MQHKISLPVFSFSRLTRIIAVLAIVSTATGIHAEDVVLTWSDNSDNEDGFNIERAIGDGEFETLVEVGADIETYTDSTAQEGIDYRYRVNAFNAFGGSGYTNVASHYINVAPTLTAIADVSVEENETAAGIVFTVSDFESDESDLSVTLSSSNSSVLDDSSIVVAGAGAEKTFTLVPILNASGESVVTVTVSDGEDSSSRDFLFSVNSFVYPTIQVTLDSIAAEPRAGESFTLQSSLSDISVVSSVSYWLGGELIETVSESPYEVSISIPETGTFTVSAIAAIAGRDQNVSADRSIVVGEAPAASSLVENLATLSVDESPNSGTASYDLATDTFLLEDENGQISGTSDSHRYYYLMAQGDVAIEAQMSSLDAASGGSVAGLMIRSALYGKATQASLLVSGNSTLNARTRLSRGEETLERQLSGSIGSNPWLRIEKSGSTLRYYTKASAAAEWSLAGQDSLDLGDEVFLGFALAGGSSEGLASVSFTRAQLEGVVVPFGVDSVKPLIPSALLISSILE